MEIILDFGSGNTCKNDPKIVKKMIDELAKVDKKRQCIIKWQLWSEDNPQGKNVRLDWEVFRYAYEYAEKKKGFNTTASIFDETSLNYLMTYNYPPMPLPFIKIANRRDLYPLIEKMPRTLPVYVSYDNKAYLPYTLCKYDKTLACISKYPAEREDYERTFRLNETMWYVSDHTIGLDMIKRQGSILIEKHYMLPGQTGLDAGPWAITPKELKEIL